MVEQTSSLQERLKACYHILTKDNYAVFCINNNHIVWNEDGTYNRIKSNSIACYCKVTYDVKFKMKGVITSFHDAFWSCIEIFAKKAQQGKVQKGE